MFLLTPDAAEAILVARTEAGAPDGWGIRFFAALDEPPGIAFDFVERPQINDILGGSDTLRTYVEATLHREIGDATVDYQGVDGDAELVVRPHRGSRAV